MKGSNYNNVLELISENMFGKGNFDGQFRTTPNVSIRGATKSENKEQLLRRAHEQRSQREV